jgi:heptosyltransferase I
VNILIVRVSAIGDVVHTLPSMFLLRKEIPHAKITWVVQEKAAALLQNQSFIENLFVLPDKFLLPKNWNLTFSIIKKLKKTKWDAIIDFQGLIKTSLLYSWLTGKKFGFDKENAREKLSTLFTEYKTTPMYSNIIQKNLCLTSQVICTLTNKKTCPSIDELSKSFFLNIPAIQSYGTPFISLAPNTTWPSKHWPAQNWIVLCDMLAQSGIKTVLIGKDFGQCASDVADYIKNKNLPITISPKMDLLATAALIKKSKLLIAPDTGLLHLADFLGIETIGIFGPTLASKHGPFLNIKNIHNAIQINCPHRYQKIHAEFNCMKQLLPEQLFKIILEKLN